MMFESIWPFLQPVLAALSDAAIEAIGIIREQLGLVISGGAAMLLLWVRSKLFAADVEQATIDAAMDVERIAEVRKRGGGKMPSAEKRKRALEAASKALPLYKRPMFTATKTLERVLPEVRRMSSMPPPSDDNQE